MSANKKNCIVKLFWVKSLLAWTECKWLLGRPRSSCTKVRLARLRVLFWKHDPWKVMCLCRCVCSVALCLRALMFLDANKRGGGGKSPIREMVRFLSFPVRKWGENSGSTQFVDTEGLFSLTLIQLNPGRPNSPPYLHLVHTRRSVLECRDSGYVWGMFETPKLRDC